MIDYQKFHKALQHLEAQNLRRKAHSSEQPDWIVEAIKESVIQRFEVCWDCLWKVLKRHLVEKIGLPDVPNGPNPVLRLANENHLLPSPIENWLFYANARVATSHDYSGKKADEALAILDAFVADAKALYEILNEDRGSE